MAQPYAGKSDSRHEGTYTVMKNKNGEEYDSIIVDCTPNLKK